MSNPDQSDPLQTILGKMKKTEMNLTAMLASEIDKTYRTSDQKEIIRRLRIQNKKQLEHQANLKRKLKQDKVDKAKLTIKIGSLEKLIHSLSEALGSCENCWGEDPGCSNCSGNGMAGWRKVNRRLFNMYVHPCLENLYKKETKIPYPPKK